MKVLIITGIVQRESSLSGSLSHEHIEEGKELKNVILSKCHCDHALGVAFNIKEDNWELYFEDVKKKTFNITDYNLVLIHKHNLNAYSFKDDLGTQVDYLVFSGAIFDGDPK